MTQRAELRLDLKRQASMIDEPLDELVLHGRARRPNPRRNIERVPQQADCAFGNHLRRRSIAGIAIARRNGNGKRDFSPAGAWIRDRMFKILIPVASRGMDFMFTYDATRGVRPRFETSGQHDRQAA